VNIGDGAVRLSKRVFEQWRSFEVFETDIGRFCSTIAARTGLKSSINAEALRKAHLDWCADHDEWLTSHKMPTGTLELSHYKQAGILLWALSANQFVLFENSPAPDPWKEVYGRLDFADDLTIRKLSDGQNHFAAWTLCHNIVVWFEEARTDRRTEFVARVTDDFETDVVSLLVSGLHTSDSLYLVLKALFFRE
jgi:hypothetical protein